MLQEQRTAYDMLRASHNNAEGECGLTEQELKKLSAKLSKLVRGGLVALVLAKEQTAWSQRQLAWSQKQAAWRGEFGLAEQELKKLSAKLSKLMRGGTFSRLD
eukprot:1161140-Pelagomonas_calceolata.AAC.3